MNFLQALRMQNIFGPTSMIGSDLPSQGGITGNIPFNPQPQQPMFNPPSQMDMGGPPQDMPVTTGLPGPTPLPGPDYSSMVTPGLPTIGADMAGNTPPQYDVNTRMNQLYHPQTTAEDAYNNMVKQYPQDRGHSKLARIGAALAGGIVGWDNPIAGYKFGSGLLDESRQNAIEDWKNQIGPMQQSANLERYGNANNRQVATQTIAEELRQQAQDARAANDTHKADIAEFRAQVYQYKAMHPNLKPDFSGPTVKFFDPSTGKTEDTKIPTGHLSDMDKITLQGETRIKEIGAQGAQTRETEGVRQKGRIELEGVRQGDKTALEGVKAGNRPGTTGKPELPSQTRVRIFNAASKLLNTRPDLRQFIKLNGNDVSIIPPGEGMFGSTGPNKQQFKEIQDAIYGNTPSPISAHSPVNRVTIYKNGRPVGTVPASQVEEAQKQGYTLK